MLLTGLIHCAKCGGAMTIRIGKGGRYRYYTCSTKADRTDLLIHAPGVSADER